MELVMNNNFSELTMVEEQLVEGGDTAKRDRIEYLKENNVTISTPESEKTAISYTLGYLSLATCWCSPVSTAIGVIGTLYTCL